MEFTVTSFPTDLIGPPSITNSSFGGLDADMAFSGASSTVLSSSALTCFDCLVDCLVDVMGVLAYGLDPMDALVGLATVVVVRDGLLADEFLLPAMTRV